MTGQIYEQYTCLVLQAARLQQILGKRRLIHGGNYKSGCHCENG